MRQTLLLVTIFISLALPKIVMGQQPIPKPKVYFHSTEAATSNFADLKTSFDVFLSEHVDHKFQPVKKKDIFEEKLNSGNFFVMTSTHFKELQKSHANLRPVLVGESNGQTVQKKVLTSKFKTIEELRNATVASSGNFAETRKLLQEILSSADEDIIESIDIVSVPKDIDALLSVGYGIADAAISSEESFETLSHYNRNQFESLTLLGETEGSVRILVVTNLAEHETPEAPIEALIKMGSADGSEQPLKMIGLDNFQMVDEDVSKLLSN